MKINVQLTQEDWQKFYRYIVAAKQKEIRGVVNSFWGNMILWCIITLSLMITYRGFGKFHLPSAAFICVLGVLIYLQAVWNSKKLQKAFVPNNAGIVVGNHVYTFDTSGIHAEGTGYKSFYSWNLVKQIVQADGMFLLFLDTAQAIIIPENQISDINEFKNEIGHRGA